MDRRFEAFGKPKMYVIFTMYDIWELGQVLMASNT